jgi:hypothetical protein
MIEIRCACRTCKTNSGGHALAANVPAALLAAMGKGARHGLVYSAHDPSFVGRVTRDRLGIVPVLP